MTNHRLQTAIWRFAGTDPAAAGQRHSKAERAKYRSSQQEIAIETLKTILRSRGDSEAAVEMVAGLAQERFENRRVHVGKLMDHGMARYMHDPNEESSYFVQLATSDGEKTLWGVDLQRALFSSGIKKGDDITISREELRHVDKFKNETGADGRPTGKKIPINAIWNRWTVGKLDEIREAAGEQISKNANDYRGMQPVIKVYDSKAPRQTDLAVPQLSRTDRPRGQEPHVVR